MKTPGLSIKRCTPPVRHKLFDVPSLAAAPGAALWGALIREWLFPEGCALCGAPLGSPAEAAGGLCRSCEGILSPDPGPRCGRCGQPLISEKGTCLSCRNGPPRSFDRVLSIFPYEGRYQKLLGAYKFGRRLSLGNLFVNQLWRGLEFLRSEGHILPARGEQTGTAEKVSGGTAWVPVPPRPGKIKKSGWDQVEYLGKLLEKYDPPRNIPASWPGGSPPPLCRCLNRLPSEVQKELDRESRRKNLRGRMVLRGPPPKIALVFDDVYTTGSTMDACAEALKAGGTEAVYGICLFYD